METTTITTATATNDRRYELDWLRVLAFGLLILFHTGMLFVTWDWHVKNPELSPTFDLFMRFPSQWRLPLLFLVSGAGVCFALGKRGTGAFVRERLKRLLLPLVFGMFVIVPPQIYYEYVSKGAEFVAKYHRQPPTSYWQFYPSVFEFQSYPGGSLSWHHLWFVVYILVYSLVFARLFVWMKKEGSAGNRFLTRVVGFSAKPFRILLWAVPLAIAAALLGPFWETTHNLVADWYNLTVSLIFFLYGFAVAFDTRLAESIKQQRYTWLSGALFTATILYWFFWTDTVWVNADHAPLSIAPYWALKYLNIWLWLLAILGFARQHLSFSTPALRYANEAVYPFYILHQTITVALGYYVVQWQMHWLFKFAIVSAGTFVLSWAMYEVIRRVNLLRPLFGLKPVTKAVPEQIPTRLVIQDPS